MPARSVEARVQRIASALRADGFEPVRLPASPSGGRGPWLLKDGALGMLGEHSRARSSVTGLPKRAYYVEGNGYQSGWLIGAMAEPHVARMAGEFVQNVAFAFFLPGPVVEKGLAAMARDLVVRIIADASQRMLPDIPAELVSEIDGLVDGCHWVNPGTTVRRDRLLALNLGIDSLLAHIYTGTMFAQRGVHPGLLRTPIGCNAFSISGDAAGGKHFFGRDFMFPTAGVFQDTACLFIRSPTPPPGEPVRPFASQGAPGFVGAITAMNSDGLAAGVDMLPSRMCDPSRPGLNSLLLLRDCVQHCRSAPEAVRRIRSAPRGVTWLYPVADAAGGAFVVEAGRRQADQEVFPYFDYTPRSFRSHLPDLSYIEKVRARYDAPAPANGVVVRGHGHELVDAYVRDWNPGLWRAFDLNWVALVQSLASTLFGGVRGLISRKIRRLGRQWAAEVSRLGLATDHSESMEASQGFIDDSWTGRNCPGPFYFAPVRVTRDDVLVVTNHAITPEMRLTSMNEWIALLAGGQHDDMQWRYDELSREIHDALARLPAIDEATAWDLVSFLRPGGRFPDYYNPGRTRPWQEVEVHGSVTLCELTSRTMTSLFGYHGDPPVTVHLPAFTPS